MKTKRPPPLGGSERSGPKDVGPLQRKTAPKTTKVEKKGEGSPDSPVPSPTPPVEDSGTTDRRPTVRVPNRKDPRTSDKYNMYDRVVLELFEEMIREVPLSIGKPVVIYTDVSDVLELGQSGTNGSHHQLGPKEITALASFLCLDYMEAKNHRPTHYHVH